MSLVPTLSVVPTLVPTRTPVTAVSVGISGIVCAAFNGTVFDRALESIVSNATFSEAACADTNATRRQLAGSSSSYSYDVEWYDVTAGPALGDEAELHPPPFPFPPS